MVPWAAWWLTKSAGTFYSFSVVRVLRTWNIPARDVSQLHSIEFTYEQCCGALDQSERQRSPVFNETDLDRFFGISVRERDNCSLTSRGDRGWIPVTKPKSETNRLAAGSIRVANVNRNVPGLGRL